MQDKIKIYCYDNNGILIKIKNARLSPKELKENKVVPLVPKNSTLIEPPSISEGDKLQFRNNSWKIITKEEIEVEKKKVRKKEQELKEELEKKREELRKERKEKLKREENYRKALKEVLVYIIEKEFDKKTIDRNSFEKSVKTFSELSKEFLY